MKRLIVFLLFVMGMPSLAWGQIGEDGKRRSYFPQIAIGDGWRVIFNYMEVSGAETGSGIGERKRLSNGEGVFPPGKYLIDDETRQFKSYINESFGLPRPSNWESYSHMGPFGYAMKSISKTPDSPGLVVGWAELIQDDANENIVASVTLQWWVDGVKITEAGVPAVEARKENFVQVFLAEKDSQKTGLAIANPSNVPVEVTLELRTNRTYLLLDNNYVFGGRGILTTVVIIPPMGHLSKFVPELFPIVFNEPAWRDTKTLGATLKIISTQPVPVLALRTSVVPGVGFMMSTLAAATPK